MFIGHLPAGYLATTALLRDEASRRRILRIGLFASVAPDLDLLYFYLVDQQRHVHHSYLPHLPLAWAVTLGAVALGMRVRGAEWASWLTLAVVAVNVFLHLAMDTVAGGIRWLWPFSDVELVLATVQPRFDHWFLNFILHWTFALEVALVVAALWRWRRG